MEVATLRQPLAPESAIAAIQRWCDRHCLEGGDLYATSDLPILIGIGWSHHPILAMRGVEHVDLIRN
jgi:hypothetical protein